MRKRGPAELAGSASDVLGKEKRLRGRILRPDQAAAIKRRQQLEKKAVRRRVALWRSRTVDGKWQTVYITLAGDVLKKGARAYRAAAADQQYLKACGIASNQPAYSEIEVPEEPDLCNLPPSLLASFSVFRLSFQGDPSICQLQRAKPFGCRAKISVAQ
ncbi:unnamed protein product [Symbiodinium necroappetens]|uniref:Uncharacterized protein n=1 Tax=Symbiodinium necroappetens TaxID=1628268 RepID=A0A813BWA2_9DINO|nr:unnamed protein product [Symbiodinium necroappetens]